MPRLIKSTAYPEKEVQRRIEQVFKNIQIEIGRRKREKIDEIRKIVSETVAQITDRIFQHIVQYYIDVAAPPLIDVTPNNKSLLNWKPLTARYLKRKANRPGFWRFVPAGADPYERKRRNLGKRKSRRKDAYQSLGAYLSKLSGHQFFGIPQIAQKNGDDGIQGIEHKGELLIRSIGRGASKYGAFADRTVRAVAEVWRISIIPFPKEQKSMGPRYTLGRLGLRSNFDRRQYLKLRNRKNVYRPLIEVVMIAYVERRIPQAVRDALKKAGYSLSVHHAPLTDKGTGEYNVRF